MGNISGVFKDLHWAIDVIRKSSLRASFLIKGPKVGHLDIYLTQFFFLFPRESAHFVVSFDAGLDKGAVGGGYVFGIRLKKALRPFQGPSSQKRALLFIILAIDLELGPPSIKTPVRVDPAAQGLPRREQGLMGDFGRGFAVTFPGDHDALLGAGEFTNESAFRVREFFKKGRAAGGSALERHVSQAHTEEPPHQGLLLLMRLHKAVGPLAKLQRDVDALLEWP